jgi:starch synthase (maltosyl-transferring)
VYTVCAWVDGFLSWRHDFERRVDADDVRARRARRCALVAQAAVRAGPDAEANLLLAWSASWPMPRHLRPTATRSGIAVERAARALARAGTSSSRARPSAARPARQLRRLRGLAALRQRMGFDVLYFPPIHPIGRARRKGRNNTLDAARRRRRQPVGDRRGRRRPRRHPERSARWPTSGAWSSARRALGIEIALDIAFQCAPDHPWVREHPSGSEARRRQHPVRREPAQEVPGHLPVRLRDADWRELWARWPACSSTGSAQGVRIFRVDNPHTKAFPFWEWAIARIRAHSPDVIFLSEAFTRPKVMHRLAKLGFSQSYTYFTWRNTKRELTDYFTELTQGARPRLLPAQRLAQHARHPARGAAVRRPRRVHGARGAGRHAGASYGIYGPAYELQEQPCRCAPAARSTSTPRSSSCAHLGPRAARLAGRLHRRAQPARRDNPALQSDAGLRFLNIDNEQMIAYAKVSPDGATSSSASSTSTRTTRRAAGSRSTSARFGLEPQQAYQMHDLIGGAISSGSGARNFVSLDPQRCPVHVMQLRARMRRENDFDYFL